MKKAVLSYGRNNLKLTKRLSCVLYDNPNFYQNISKCITTNFHNNFIEPSNKQEEIEDVKYWLNTNKPKYLCIFFTNNWNPVCKEGNKEYNKFAKSTGVFKNLRIDTEQYPRLKWYFDSKHEPGFHFYYFGSFITSLGGCNFEKASKEIKRIVNYVENDPDQNQYNINNITYEQPYFKFENEISRFGVEEGMDPYQFYKPMFFSGFTTLKEMPYEEKWSHTRLKK